MTLQKPKEEPDDKADSIFDICTEFDLKELFLVEDNMSSFLEAYSNAEELKIKLNFGLRLTFCDVANLQNLYVAHNRILFEPHLYKFL